MSENTTGGLVKELRALHVPWYEYDGVRHHHVGLVDPDESHVCRTEGTDQCVPDLDEHYALACNECRGSWFEGEIPTHQLWPCATARLLDAHASRTMEAPTGALGSVHEPRCNTYCTPGTHHLTSGIGYPHIHRTDIAAECGQCVESGASDG